MQMIREACVQQTGRMSSRSHKGGYQGFLLSKFIPGLFFSAALILLGWKEFTLVWFTTKAITSTLRLSFSSTAGSNNSIILIIIPINKHFYRSEHINIEQHPSILKIRLDKSIFYFKKPGSSKYYLQMQRHPLKENGSGKKHMLCSRT